MIPAPGFPIRDNTFKNCFTSSTANELLRDEQAFNLLPLHKLSNIEIEKFTSPRRNNNYQIIFIKHGSATCKVDMESYELSEKNIGYIYPGQIYQLLPGKDIYGFILSFSRDFFHLSIEKHLLASQPAFSGITSTAEFPADDYVKEDINEVIIRIEKEFSSTRPLKAEVLKGLLRILLIYLSRISNGITINLSPNKNNKIVKNFFSVLEERYNTNRMATYYANALSVTTNFLNDLLKKTTGYTTSHHIHQRVLTEAKRLTIYSNISMKEIAYTLGFEDMAHFSKFFKKNSGVSFKEFKRKIIR